MPLFEDLVFYSCIFAILNVKELNANGFDCYDFSIGFKTAQLFLMWLEGMS